MIKFVFLFTSTCLLVVLFELINNCMSQKVFQEKGKIFCQKAPPFITFSKQNWTEDLNCRPLLLAKPFFDPIVILFPELDVRYFHKWATLNLVLQLHLKNVCFYIFFYMWFLTMDASPMIFSLLYIYIYIFIELWANIIVSTISFVKTRYYCFVLYHIWMCPCVGVFRWDKDTW